MHCALQSSDFRSFQIDFHLSTMLRKQDAQRSPHDPKTPEGITEEANQPTEMLKPENLSF